MRKHLVAVLVYDQLCTFEFACAVELFGRPREFDPWYNFTLAGVEPGLLTSTAGIQFAAPHGLERLADADTIIIPGWSSIHDSVPDKLCVAMREAHARGARLASICSGVFVLADAGLLDGRRATTHWLYGDVLKKRFPAIHFMPDVLYVDEGQVLSSAGSAAGIDLMLHMIRKDHGAKVCNSVARRLVVPPHRSGGQSQYIERPVPTHEASRLSAVIDYLRANPSHPHSVSDIAAMAAMSPRNFYRRFRESTGLSPQDWLTRERLEIAKILLEEADQSVDQIAGSSGFRSTAAFRHHFRRSIGLSPGEYRKAFDRQGTGPGG